MSLYLKLLPVKKGLKVENVGGKETAGVAHGQPCFSRRAV